MGVVSVNMATVVVQVGQCGNQIGTQLFSVLRSDSEAALQGRHYTYSQATLDRFFTESRLATRPPSAKAVLIDMEPKAIQSSLTEANRTGSWTYDTSSVYSGNRGSGNNWANGFYCHGPKAGDAVLDIVQKQAEKCNNLEGFLVVMSVAGGTGSGMGAYVTELFKDNYPGAVLINPVVWPYTSGEVIVQNYNALLTTAHLSQVSDAIIPLLNDHLHQVGSKCLRLKEVSFNDLNKIASHAIASILQPASPSTNRSFTVPDSLMYQYCSLSDLCLQLTPHPAYRFLSVKTVPQIPDKSHAYTTDLWPGLLKRLKQMLITNSATDEGMDWSLKPHPIGEKSIANLLIVRGKDSESVSTESFSENDIYCKWMRQSSLRFSSWCSPVSFNKYEKSCSLVTNSSSCREPLNIVTDKAWRMYCAKAYVHQYLRCGLSEEHFMEAFVRSEQILKDYSTL